MAQLEQIKKDIKTLKHYKDMKHPSITDKGNIYEVYERYGFLDPQYDNMESAISALELREYEIKSQKYNNGEWKCEVPPVCTAQWNKDAWIKHIDYSGMWQLVIIQPGPTRPERDRNET